MKDRYPLKKVKIVVADRPYKLEVLINEELKTFNANGARVIDIKYAISRDIGSAVIIFEVC